MKDKKLKLDFISVILIIILCILIYCYAQITIMGKPYVNFCGHTVFQVITGSMSGVIEIKDVVIVKLTKAIEVNDIITYESQGNFITHRVIEKDGNTLITKGDANTSEDSPIELNNVVGKVVKIIPNVGTWLEVIKAPQVIIAIIVTLIVIKLLFFSEIKK